METSESHRRKSSDEALYPGDLVPDEISIQAFESNGGVIMHGGGWEWSYISHTTVFLSHSYPRSLKRMRNA